MNILGIYGAFFWDSRKNDKENWMHDSGATIISHGNHICSISEERISRVKYDGNFPINSINYCLKEANLKNAEIDLIVVPTFSLEKFFHKKEKFISELKNIFPNSEIRFVSHHLSHAASAIFTSDMEKGAFIILDGGGSVVPYNTNIKENLDFSHIESNSFGYFDKSKKKINLFNLYSTFNSFGHFYSSCSYLILKAKKKNINVNKELIDKHHTHYKSFLEYESSPGKIMGLSAYGKLIKDWKKYDLSKEDFEHIPYITFPRFLEQIFEDINPEDASKLIQENFEMALFDYIVSLKQNQYIEENLCLAGGSFLNVLANSKIKKSGIVKNIHIPPFTNDIGLHFGAACYYAFLKNEKLNLPKNISLLGKKYNENEIQECLMNSGLSFEKYEDFNKLCCLTSEHLKDNKIIGWFQNRSEFGARALGSRSILMNPKYADNKDILNSRIKHREYWRPFAGIILEDKLGEYFEEDFKSPYMLYSFTVKPDKINEIAAITHVDNTCRIQTVSEEYNYEVTQLIREFYKLTGTPVILNTSFNDNGQPIVETPKDAIETFKKLDLDYLVIGNYIVKK